MEAERNGWRHRRGRRRRGDRCDGRDSRGRRWWLGHRDGTGSTRCDRGRRWRWRQRLHGVRCGGPFGSGRKRRRWWCGHRRRRGKNCSRMEALEELAASEARHHGPDTSAVLAPPARVRASSDASQRRLVESDRVRRVRRAAADVYRWLRRSLGPRGVFAADERCHEAAAADRVVRALGHEFRPRATYPPRTVAGVSMRSTTDATSAAVRCGRTGPSNPPTGSADRGCGREPP